MDKNKDKTINETEMHDLTGAMLDIVFRANYCKSCGSQRCTGEGKRLEGCEKYKKFLKNMNKE